MASEGFAYAVTVIGVVVGLAALLAAEAFHGVEYLLWVGGAIALASVGGLTLLISQYDPPADAHEH
jgi:hypothetical protein